MAGTTKEDWDTRWANGVTGWDVGEPTIPLAEYIDQLTDKNLRILIPGCGNAYEAQYLHQLGFANIYVIDIAQAALDSFQQRVPEFPSQHLVCGDFFAHSTSYDLILEQTFYCAIDPSLRDRYVQKMHDLLVPSGKLVGLLWDDPMFADHPPYGGSIAEYRERFSPLFELKTLEACHNSIKPRAGREAFIIAQKPPA